MEHLDNDLDDLFRKAGEQYPLRISDSDWDSVLGKLKGEQAGEQTGIPVIGSRSTVAKRRWLLLLLLIPLGLFTLLYLQPSKNQTQKVKPFDTRQPEKSGTSARNKNKEENIITENKAGQPDQLNGMTLPEKDIQVSGQKVNKSGNSIEQERLNKRSITASAKETVNSSGNETVNHSGSEIEQESLNKTSIIASTAADSTKKVISGTPSEKINQDKPVAGPSEAKTKKTDTKSASRKGFYVSVLAGPDLSTVKFQSVKQPGFSVGVLAGYHINKRFSLETGILWDKKYYYSSGEYVNKAKIVTMPNEEILNVTGNCNMFEIPIALQYDFASARDHGFYAKAGLSSYFMKKENYNYTAQEVPGNPWAGNASYKNSGNTILSIVDLSAGYEHKLGTKTNIWFEPYLKIPLNGVGIGSLPISSTGFYLGISYSFR